MRCASELRTQVQLQSRRRLFLLLPRSIQAFAFQGEFFSHTVRSRRIFEMKLLVLASRLAVVSL